MVVERSTLEVNSMTDQEVYGWWACHNTGKVTAERELARRMLERKVTFMDGDLFQASLRPVPGTSRSEIVVIPKER